MRYLLIGLGGAVGSMLRYAVTVGLQGGGARFPTGTLAVNLIGCFAIGVLAELSDSSGLLSPDMRGLLMVGLLGGFTTFSAFTHETLNAARADDYLVVAGNILLSVGLGLAAVWLGRGVVGLVGGGG